MGLWRVEGSTKEWVDWDGFIPGHKHHRPTTYRLETGEENTTHII